MDNTEGIGSDDNTETVSGVGEDASKDRTEGETKEQEDKMKADEINLTVEQEEEPSHDSRYLFRFVFPPSSDVLLLILATFVKNIWMVMIVI